MKPGMRRSLALVLTQNSEYGMAQFYRTACIHGLIRHDVDSLFALTTLQLSACIVVRSSGHSLNDGWLTSFFQRDVLGDCWYEKY